jgi:hypothetical protein
MTVRLNCGHTRPDDRVQGGEAYCGRCFGVRQVIAHYGEYHVKCVTCPYGRKFGTDQAAASRAALRHQKVSGHAVRCGPIMYRASTQIPLFHV